MPKYDFYRELREHMGYVLRKTAGISKKKARKGGADPVSDAMRMFFRLPESGMTLDAAILADEEDYIRQGRRVFIPQDESLIRMLWRSKMSVELADLGSFPRSFSVAWPAGTVVDGVELTGCLVWFGRRRDREQLAKMMEKWTGVPTELSTMGGYQTPPDEHSFHLVFGQGSGVDRWYMRASMPEVWISECLRSADDLDKKLGAYASPFIKKLEPEELHKQYVLVRSVIHLMVYATACPDAAVRGWPEGLGPSPQTRRGTPTMLASPKEREGRGGTHASPEAHFRSGCDDYFRSYPRRKDGSKKPGIYMVRGHGGGIVNAEIDPTTVVRLGGGR